MEYRVGFYVLWIDGTWTIEEVEAPGPNPQDAIEWAQRRLWDIAKEKGKVEAIGGLATVSP